MYGFITSEGVESSVTTAHFLGDELSADVESCSCCSVLGGVGKKLQTCHSIFTSGQRTTIIQSQKPIPAKEQEHAHWLNTWAAPTAFITANLHKHVTCVIYMNARILFRSCQFPSLGRQGLRTCRGLQRDLYGCQKDGHLVTEECEPQIPR